MQRVPLQYLAGEWDFLGLTFKVGPGVLCPRAAARWCAKLPLSCCSRWENLSPGAGPVRRNWLPGIGIRICAKCQRDLRGKSPQALQYLQANVHGTGVQAKAADVLQYWRELMPKACS